MMEQVVREELIVVEIAGVWALISLEVMGSRMQMAVFIPTRSGSRMGKEDSFGFDGGRTR